jgi:hypothetical protein
VETSDGPGADDAEVHAFKSGDGVNSRKAKKAGEGELTGWE